MKISQVATKPHRLNQFAAIIDATELLIIRNALYLAITDNDVNPNPEGKLIKMFDLLDNLLST